MGKYSPVKQLSKTQIDEIFIDFAKAVASVRNSVEAANLIKDLLSEPEVVMLARRLQVARLLNDGYTYDEIRKSMRMSNTTITKVHTWMNLYGEGFRTVLKRTESKVDNPESRFDKTSLAHLKRRYPHVFLARAIVKGNC